MSQNPPGPDRDLPPGGSTPGPDATGGPATAPIPTVPPSATGAPAAGSAPGTRPDFSQIVEGASAPSRSDLKQAPAKGMSTRTKILIAIAAAIVVIGGGLGIAGAAGVFRPDPVVVTPPPVTAPAPTPDVDPVRADIATPFYTALPDAVLDFALVDTQPAEQWTAAGAVEAYTLTYSNGTDQVTLTTGQWPDDAAATQAAAALGLALDASATGPNAQVETLSWQNATTLFSLDDPTGTHAARFYLAFPL